MNNKQFYGPSFGVVNLIARGDKAKYFPSEFLKEFGLSNLTSREIHDRFIQIGMDADGDFVNGWYINLKANVFIKKN